MPLIIGENNLELIRNLDIEFNVIVETENRIMEEFFNKSRLYGYQTHTISDYQLLGYQGHFGLRQNKNVDKIEISLTEGSFYERFEELSRYIAYSNGKTVYNIRMRILFIMGFAVTALIPGSKISIFRGPQNQQDILLGHCSDSLNSIVPKSIKSKLTGDTDEDIATLFNFFWYYYPNDITGNDNGLIKSTMSHNLGMRT